MSIASFREQFFGILLRLGFFFEPLAPPAISFFINRKFGEFKERGLIGDYSTETHRLGKFHYKVEIDMEINDKQTAHFLDEIYARLEG